jgi:hypothetical protein
MCEPPVVVVMSELTLQPKVSFRFADVNTFAYACINDIEV